MKQNILKNEEGLAKTTRTNSKEGRNEAVKQKRPDDDARRQVVHVMWEGDGLFERVPVDGRRRLHLHLIARLTSNEHHGAADALHLYSKGLTVARTEAEQFAQVVAVRHQIVRGEAQSTTLHRRTQLDAN